MDESYLKSFKDRRIAVVGDVMLDHYIYARPKDISPEAPVMNADFENEVYSLGGAANVAKNVKSLGGDVTLYGVTGGDHNGTILYNLLEQNEIRAFLLKEGSVTTIKTRIMLTHQHSPDMEFIKINYDGGGGLISSFDATGLIQLIQYLNTEYDGIILSDYNKGIFTDNLTSKIITYADKSKIPVVVDPKPNNIKQFRDSTVVCPNFEEIERMLPLDYSGFESHKSKLAYLQNLINCKYVVMTCGSDGMISYDGELINHKAKTQEVFDVMGAGDTVAATLGLALSVGMNIHMAAEVANQAAGLVVKKQGTASVSLDELIDSFNT